MLMATKVKRQELINILDKSNAEKVTVCSRKELKMNKTNNPFYKKEGRCWVPQQLVEKVSTVTYLYGGGSYEERVNEALKADGSTNVFEAKSLPWGKWWIDNKIIEHNGQFYLRCYLDRDSDDKPEVQYLVDGKPATDSQLKDIDAFEIKNQDAIGSNRQTNEGLSAEKQVIPQNVKFENIVYIIIDDVEYELND
jgi:hypothetical protein